MQNRSLNLAFARIGVKAQCIGLLLVIGEFLVMSSLLMAANSPLSNIQVQSTPNGVSIEAKSASVADILRSLGTQFGFEVIAHEQGPIRNFSMKEVSLPVILDKILLGNNFIIEYVPGVDRNSSSSRSIERIFLLSRVSPEKAEEERSSRQVLKANDIQKNDHEAALPADHANSDFSSDSSTLSNEPDISGNIPTSTTRSPSFEAYQSLNQQLNPNQNSPFPVQNHEIESVSNQQIPLSLQQQALQQVKELAERLEKARQQVDVP